jgi:threonine dehydrogenase-like Zn-dependent dehydrogenase
MRFFAGLLGYLVGVSAVISIGIVGLMALQPANRTPSAPIVAAAQKERLAKPVKQKIVDDKKAQPDQKHKVVQVTGKKVRPNPTHKMVQDTHKPMHEAPTTVADQNAYGYAQEPRRIDPNLFSIFGRR